MGREQGLPRSDRGTTKGTHFLYLLELLFGCQEFKSFQKFALEDMRLVLNGLGIAERVGINGALSNFQTMKQDERETDYEDLHRDCTYADA